MELRSKRKPSSSLGRNVLERQRSEQSAGPGGWRLSCALSADGDGVCRDDQKVQAEKMDEEEPPVLVHPRESSQEEFCDPLIL